MSIEIRCRCPRCTIRGLTGPAVVITVGVLFLLQQTRGGEGYGFNGTYPVILIVIGAIRLASSLAPMDGHISGLPAPPAVPPGPGAASAPTPTSMSEQGR